LRTWALAVHIHLPKPEGCSRKKALRRLPLLKREPNAGLVSLTMTCLSYLLVALLVAVTCWTCTSGKTT